MSQWGVFQIGGVSILGGWGGALMLGGIVFVLRSPITTGQFPPSAFARRMLMESCAGDVLLGKESLVCFYCVIFGGDCSSPTYLVGSIVQKAIRHLNRCAACVYLP